MKLLWTKLCIKQRFAHLFLRYTIYWRRKATIIKNKIHQSVLHQSFPSAESLPKGLLKYFFSWKKKINKRKKCYVEKMTKITLKRKWVQKNDKTWYQINFSSLFLTVYGSHSLICVQRNLILLGNTNSNVSTNQENGIRLPYRVFFPTVFIWMLFKIWP